MIQRESDKNLSPIAACDEATFLRCLRDVLAPPAGGTAPRTWEQDLALDDINTRLASLNRAALSHELPTAKCAISKVENPKTGAMQWCETHGYYFGLGQECPVAPPSSNAAPVLTEMFLLNLSVCVEGIVDVPQTARASLLKKLTYLRETLKSSPPSATLTPILDPSVYDETDQHRLAPSIDDDHAASEIESAIKEGWKKSDLNFSIGRVWFTGNGDMQVRLRNEAEARHLITLLRRADGTAKA